MGIYLNPNADLFQIARNSRIYVDKSKLLAYTNSVIRTEDRFICASRPRRFGKTMTANMLAAYYSKNGSRALFDDLAIANDPSYAEHLNKYNVIFINTKNFLPEDGNAQQLITSISQAVISDLKREFPQVPFSDAEDLTKAMLDCYALTGERFIFIFDEWDCLVRENPEAKKDLRAYLHFLERLLKDRPYVDLAYITGIMPIHKYGSQSALNMFREFSMTTPRNFAEFVGFTDTEVQKLCQNYNMDYAEMRRWYDGYRLSGFPHVYTPCSVVQAINARSFENYWTNTESFNSLSGWIAMNYDGLRDSIISMLGDVPQKVNTLRFSNSFSEIYSRDDVLSLLIHLGYLGFDAANSQVFIPNQEIAAVFVSAIEANSWSEVMASINASEKLLADTWNRDGQAVAKAMDQTYTESSILAYNDENSLACRLSLAYYTARQYYTVIREMPAGKGFADLVFIPRPNHGDKPALVIELKWNISAASAIEQIKCRHYPDSLRGFKGHILLVGLNYDKKEKCHECIIENMDILR
ncbi:AAA family ATPase [bacterium]|nr:AAA family ATPase [bacterium]